MTDLPKWIVSRKTQREQEKDRYGYQLGYTGPVYLSLAKELEQRKDEILKSKGIENTDSYGVDIFEYMYQEKQCLL